MEANVAKTKLAVPISGDAFFRRFARALKRKSQKLRSPRGRGNHDGAYFIIDTEKETLVATNLTMVDLVKRGRELGCVKPWEEVERG
jgi:hypothetical protein